MILWNHQAENAWTPDPLIHLEGKRFEKWASPEIVAAVSACFSIYRVEDTWNSLFAMIELFTRLARETSSHLHIAYPLQSEQDIIRYLQCLRDGSVIMKTNHVQVRTAPRPGYEQAGTLNKARKAV